LFEILFEQERKIKSDPVPLLRREMLLARGKTGLLQSRPTGKYIFNEIIHNNDDDDLYDDNHNVGDDDNINKKNI
jgi:hypothetical protein